MVICKSGGYKWGEVGKSSIFSHLYTMSTTEPKPISYAGEFKRSLDKKHRVTIPSVWLNAGVDEFHSIPSPKGDCLMVMPPNEFNSIEERFKQSALPPSAQRQAIRHFYSQARAVAADSEGRVLLPFEQCEALQLDGEVILVGGHSRFEIWTPTRWAEVLAEGAVIFNQGAEMIGL